MTDLALLDAVAQVDLVRRAEVTPLDLVDAAIERIERVDPVVNAVAIPLFDRARKAAIDLAPAPAALPGITTVVKDTVPSGGDPWHRGMVVLRDLDHHAEQDAHVVGRARAAGMALVGKANVGELEGGITVEPVAHGPTRNPWDLALSVGGSSGGPAAAVAAGLVPIGIGVDGGGSIRIPASICGVVGLKPSRGRTSLWPQFVEDGHSTAGVLTRTVRDAAVALDALAGVPHGDHWVAPAPVRPFAEEVGVDPGALRIGAWTAQPGGLEVHGDCLAAVDDAAGLLASLGHAVEASHPTELDSSFFRRPEFMIFAACHIVFQVRQLEQELGRALGEDDLEPVTWACLQAAGQVPATQLQAAIEVQRHAAVRYAAWWDDGFDLLLTPTIAVPPYPLGALSTPSAEDTFPDIGAWVPFTPHVNGAGLPAVSLPLWWNDAGQPIGVQLVAAYGREDLLLRVAAQLEQARPWADRRPPVFASADQGG